MVRIFGIVGDKRVVRVVMKMMDGVILMYGWFVLMF